MSASARLKYIRSIVSCSPVTVLQENRKHTEAVLAEREAEQKREHEERAQRLAEEEVHVVDRCVYQPHVL